MQEQYIPERVKNINAQIAAQGNKGYSVAPSEMYSPTVFTDANIRETTIPSIISKAQKLVGNESKAPILDDKGNTVAVYNRNMGGYRDVNSGGEYQPPEPEQENEYDSLYKDRVDGLGIPSPEDDPYFKLIESMQSRSDASTQNLLSAVSSEYQQLRSDLQRSQESTTAQLRGAQRRLGSRYTPLSSPQTMQTKLDSDMRAMSDLTSKEAIDKNKILSAQADKDFELMGKQIEVLESRRKEKAAIAEKIIEDIQTERDAVRDYNFKNQVEQAKVQANIDEVLKQAQINGAPTETLKKIVNSVSVTEALLNAEGFVGDNMERSFKQAQIENLKSETAKRMQDTLIDSPGYKTAKAQSEILDNLSLVSGLLEDPYLSQVTGLKNPLTYWTPGSNEQYAKNQLNQVVSILSLENRQKLKGSGAISDFESLTLQKASSSLGKNLSDADAKRELSKIKGAFSTAAGLPATVKITDPTTGKYKIMESTRDGIDQAIIDGAIVEYQ